MKHVWFDVPGGRECLDLVGVDRDVSCDQGRVRSGTRAIRRPEDDAWNRVFDRTPGAVVLSVDVAAATPLDAIVLTGESIEEPVARYGPFVMNTRAEIAEAIDDFNADRMGSIHPGR